MKLKVLFALILIATGLAAAGVSELPKYGIKDAGDWGEVREDRIEVISTLWIESGGLPGLNLENWTANYEINMNGVKLAEGEKKGLELDEGRQTVKFRTWIEKEKLERWWITHLKNGEKSDMLIHGNLRGKVLDQSISLGGLNYRDEVKTNFEGAFDESLSEMEKNYSFNAVLVKPEVELRESNAKIGEVKDEITPVLISMKVHNPNNFPIPRPGTTGVMDMNGVRVAEWNQGEGDGQLIQPGETAETEFEVNLENQKMGEWLASHAKKGERSEGAMRFNFLFNIRGRSFTLPPKNRIECSFEIQTSLLEEDQKEKTRFTECDTPL